MIVVRTSFRHRRLIWPEDCAQCSAMFSLMGRRAMVRQGRPASGDAAASTIATVAATNGTRRVVFMGSLLGAFERPGCPLTQMAFSRVERRSTDEAQSALPIGAPARRDRRAPR